MEEQIIKLPDVMRQTKKGKSSVYDDPTFPKPVKIGPRASGWLQSEVSAWIAARKAERDALFSEEKLACDAPSSEHVPLRSMQESNKEPTFKALANIRRDVGDPPPDDNFRDVKEGEAA